jgi:hypothetical protein
MREDTIIREIKEEYTPEEVSAMGKKLAGKMADMEAVQSEKSAADASFNERKKVLQSEAETLYRQINKGYEMAQIGCDIRYNDPSPGQKSYYRMDTSAHVETVNMSWEEKQEELQFNLNAPAAAEGQPQPTEDQVNEALGKMASEPEPEPEPEPGEPYSREDEIADNDGRTSPESDAPRRRGRKKKDTPPPEVPPPDPPEAAAP